MWPCFCKRIIAIFALLLPLNFPGSELGREAVWELPTGLCLASSSGDAPWRDAFISFML